MPAAKSNISQRLAERKKALVAPVPSLVAVVIYVLTGVNVDPAVALTIIGAVTALVTHQTTNAPKV